MFFLCSSVLHPLLANHSIIFLKLFKIIWLKNEADTGERCDTLIKVRISKSTMDAVDV